MDKNIIKIIIKENINGIVFALIFLAVTQWILWSHTLGNYIPPHDYPTYDSLEQYTKENTNSDCSYNIIAQDDKNAVCFVAGNGYTDVKILSKTESEKWIELIKDTDYKIKFYINKNNNEFDDMYVYSLSNSERKIIIVEENIYSTKSEEYIFNEEEEKLKSISDSQNTIFNYYAIQSKTIAVLFAEYVGFVDNFDKNTYTLYINDKEYPFKQWQKLLR